MDVVGINGHTCSREAGKQQADPRCERAESRGGSRDIPSGHNTCECISIALQVIELFK